MISVIVNMTAKTGESTPSSPSLPSSFLTLLPSLGNFPFFRSDEEGCDTSSCNICSDGNTTYSDQEICDCNKNCDDAADELNCRNKEGTYRNFICKNGDCYRRGRCNGRVECEDGEDEEDCGGKKTTIFSFSCPENLS